MADGTYERRGPREAELKRFQRLLATCREKKDQPPAVRALVSFGSNIEPRRETIDRALQALQGLPQTRLVKVSSIVETAPVDVPAAYRHLPFLNGVAVVETTLSPFDFIHRLQEIENALGRVRTIRNGPRTIDLDVIDFGGLKMATPELTLPHPRARERAFVMEPLAELGIELEGLRA